MKYVSFIILNYNDSETTIKLVDSLLKWDAPLLDLHIIVVDNRSTDNSYALLKKKYNNQMIVDVCISERNGGYSYGNNFGTRYAIEKYNSEYIAIANPDILIDLETFTELMNTFTYDKSIAMCAPVMRDLKGKYSIHSQSIPGYFDDLKACFNSSKSKTLIKKDIPYLRKNCILTEMIPGSFFVVRSDFYKSVDMLDEGVFLFCEERILGKKFKDAGYKLIIREDLFFLHAHSTSIKKTYDTIKTWKILMKSRMYYQKKYGNNNVIKLLVLKIAMEMYLFGLSVKLNLYHLIKG